MRGGFELVFFRQSGLDVDSLIIAVNRNKISSERCFVGHFKARQKDVFNVANHLEIGERERRG